MPTQGEYMRLGEGDVPGEIDDLVQSHPPKRGYNRDQGEYVALEELDELGNAIERPEVPRLPLNGATLKRRRPKGLLTIWFGTIFGLLLVVGLMHRFSGHRVQHRRAKNSNGTHDFYPTTLVISLDGFHPHYASPERTPALDEFVRNGVAVPFMIPSFPSQTFPNHWTLATGMHPMNHGIVGNSFYDPQLGREFRHTDPENSRDKAFWGAEPVWVTAKKNGRRTAVHMWPGSEVDWEDSLDIVDPFNKHEKLPAKLDRLLGWLDRDIETRPELIMAYVPNIDTVGHQHGIAGVELDNEIRQVDTFIDGLLRGLKSRNLTEVVNLIVLSDHGMAPTSDDRLLFLDDHLKLDQVSRRTGWPLVGLRFNDHTVIEEIRANLTAHVPKKAAKVYKTEKMPPEWNFNLGGKYSYRLPPLYVVPEVGYSILTHEEYKQMGEHYNLAGVHGYNPQAALMRAFFAASGPSFKQGRYQSFSNVNVYSLICASMHLVPAKTDGEISLVDLTSRVAEVYPDVPFEVETLSGPSTFFMF